MAKRAKGKQVFPGVYVTTPEIRHAKRLTMPADSSTGIAEALDTPGYAESGMSGCLISRCVFRPDLNIADHGLAATDVTLVCQLQTGNRVASATATVLDPDEVGFFAEYGYVSKIATNGILLHEYPKALHIAPPIPVIVMPEMTVLVKTQADSAGHDSGDYFVDIYYHKVELDERAYVPILMQQQRTS